MRDSSLRVRQEALKRVRMVWPASQHGKQPAEHSRVMMSVAMLLRDSCAQIRWQALKALKHICPHGHRRGVDAVLIGLKDSHPRVREAAIEAVDCIMTQEQITGLTRPGGMLEDVRLQRRLTMGKRFLKHWSGCHLGDMLDTWKTNAEKSARGKASVNNTLRNSARFTSTARALSSSRLIKTKGTREARGDANFFVTQSASSQLDRGSPLASTRGDKAELLSLSPGQSPRAAAGQVPDTLSHAPAHKPAVPRLRLPAKASARSTANTERLVRESSQSPHMGSQSKTQRTWQQRPATGRSAAGVSVAPGGGGRGDRERASTVEVSMDSALRDPLVPPSDKIVLVCCLSLGVRGQALGCLSVRPVQAPGGWVQGCLSVCPSV